MESPISPAVASGNLAPENFDENFSTGTEEAVRHLEGEIAKLQEARSRVYDVTGKASIDPMALGREDEHLGERIRQLKIQLAQLSPVEPEPEDL